MSFFVPGATPTVIVPSSMEIIDAPATEGMTEQQKMSLFRAYLTYTGITTALPMGHETMGALVGARAGTQLAGKYGSALGGVVGYLGAIAIVGGVVTAVDPADLYEGGLAELIPPHISEPFAWGFKVGLESGPIGQSPQLQYLKKEAGHVKQDLWTEPKEFAVKYW